MSTIVTRAGKGSALTWTEGDANVTNLNNDKIEDIVEDTSPQLGGDLDVNSHSIVSASNGNIAIMPNGSGNIQLIPTTGKITLGACDWPTTTGSTGQVLTSGGGAGTLTWSTISGGYPQITNDNATNSDFYILFDNATSGDASSVLVSSTGLKYNPMQGKLTVTQVNGAFDGALGLNSPSTGAFTTISASSTVSGTGFTTRFASPGPIGNTSASTGAFTTLSASSTVSGTGFSTYLASPPAIGGTAAAAGSFTTLTSTGRLVMKDLTETVYTSGSTTGTITPDVANGTVQKITLTGSITFNAFANPVAGQSLTLIVTQSASGNLTLTSTMKFAGGTKTLSTAANAIDIITVFYDGSTYWASLGKGFA